MRKRSSMHLWCSCLSLKERSNIQWHLSSVFGSATDSVKIPSECALFPQLKWKSQQTLLHRDYFYSKMLLRAEQKEKASVFTGMSMFHELISMLPISHRKRTFTGNKEPCFGLIWPDCVPGVLLVYMLSHGLETNLCVPFLQQWSLTQWACMEAIEVYCLTNSRSFCSSQKTLHVRNTWVCLVYVELILQNLQNTAL